MASGGGGFSGEMAELRASVEAILKLAASLLARNMEVAVEEIGDLLEKEISAATLAIEDAATRIQVRVCGWPLPLTLLPLTLLPLTLFYTCLVLLFNFDKAFDAV